MPSVQYYVASSLDGFIATADDDLAWLLQFDGFEGGKESYETFMVASAASPWAGLPTSG
ncbi:hypothetical protein ARGLB_091_00520 [Arthrobacter globiformis NBRC 12137]|uniref:Bacterial bifunctional deaminase-reductase C-terminal domain-containing protein n=1 Tax=Arthrobacter globiformis (strain ATCC 8010 / DSM 20124 / JCM 1332 / NBRC 12137 / NCIMB 8907 / NRRL B-2979 / 168) TaxID=1077972 RepID=H0QSB1_ARTG1|nr:hypothetical protein ARGLB_091_00520 [Arthrobacter globiformis NBRC 12137]